EIAGDQCFRREFRAGVEPPVLREVRRDGGDGIDRCVLLQIAHACASNCCAASVPTATMAAPRLSMVTATVPASCATSHILQSGSAATIRNAHGSPLRPVP